MERNKGNSLLTKLERFVVIDLETTGYDPRYDQIIECAGIKVVNNKIVDTFESLVKPTIKIDSFITELTGISNDMVSMAKPIDAVLPEFIEFIGDDVILGHNIHFYINFIYDNLLEINGTKFCNDFIDTMRLARRVLPNLEHHRLKDIREHYHVDIEKEHRSLDDCICALNIYERLINEAESKNIDLSKKKNYKNPFYNVPKAKDSIPQCKPNQDSHIYNQNIVFTGSLEKMTRKEAMQLVANCGGNNEDRVTKKTNYLVLGNNAYSMKLKDGKSSKMKRAEQLINDGADLKIISEDVFFDLLL